MNRQESTRNQRPPKRLIFRLVLLLILACSIGAHVYRFLLVPSIGKGPAGPEVPAELFASPWTERHVLLLGLGDSITDGFGASPGNSYFERLVSNPPGEFPGMKGKCLGAVLPNLETLNRSVSGSTSISCLESQIPYLNPQGPDTLGLVVITTGGNDLIHFYGRTPPKEGAMYGATLKEAKPWIANYRKRLDDIIDGIEALFPGGCRILLANIYDPSDNVGDPTVAGLPPWDELLKVHGAYNDAIAQCAKAHDSVWLVDIYSEFLGHGVHCCQPWRPHYRFDDPHYWYYANIEDPNDRGYDAIRRLFLLKAAEALRAPTSPAPSP